MFLPTLPAPPPSSPATSHTQVRPHLPSAHLPFEQTEASIISKQHCTSLPPPIVADVAVCLEQILVGKQIGLSVAIKDRIAFNSEN